MPRQHRPAVQLYRPPGLRDANGDVIPLSKLESVIPEGLPQQNNGNGYDHNERVGQNQVGNKTAIYGQSHGQGSNRIHHKSNQNLTSGSGSNRTSGVNNTTTSNQSSSISTSTTSKSVRSAGSKQNCFIQHSSTSDLATNISTPAYKRSYTSPALQPGQITAALDLNANIAFQRQQQHFAATMMSGFSQPSLLFPPNVAPPMHLPPSVFPTLTKTRFGGSGRVGSSVFNLSSNNNNNGVFVAREGMIHRALSGPIPSLGADNKLMAQVVKNLEALDLARDVSVQRLLSDRLASGNNDEAKQVAQLLVQQVIENSKPSKIVAKLCGQILESPTGQQFHSGLVLACKQYLDCSDTLRKDHFRYWLNYLTFLTDLYSIHSSTYNGQLIRTLFACYEFMLNSPVLEKVSIEELESIISCLLNCGYDLERECPEELSQLRIALRDAFIAASEPWARKVILIMLLLLIELSASGWKLPSEANEYYFQMNQSSDFKSI